MAFFGTIFIGIHIIKKSFRIFILLFKSSLVIVIKKYFFIFLPNSEH